MRLSLPFQRWLERLQGIPDHHPRQLDTDTRWMCKKHLIIEHSDLHILVEDFHKKRRRTKFWLKKSYINTRTIHARHQDLVLEMTKRGIVHNSPLPRFEHLYERGNVSKYLNTQRLLTECDQCANKYYGLAGYDVGVTDE